jgi:hypothetical protein
LGKAEEAEDVLMKYIGIMIRNWAVTAAVDTLRYDIPLAYAEDFKEDDIDLSRFRINSQINAEKMNLVIQADKSNKDN